MLNGETSHRWPYFLPDGQHFLYFAGVSTEVASIQVAGLDSSDTKLLFPARSNAAYTSDYVFKASVHLGGGRLRHQRGPAFYIRRVRH